jgi:hypothetical protein
VTSARALDSATGALRFLRMDDDVVALLDCRNPRCFRAGIGHLARKVNHAEVLLDLVEHGLYVRRRLVLETGQVFGGLPQLRFALGDLGPALAAIEDAKAELRADHSVVVKQEGSAILVIVPHKYEKVRDLFELRCTHPGLRLFHGLLCGADFRRRFLRHVEAFVLCGQLGGRKAGRLHFDLRSHWQTGDLIELREQIGLSHAGLEFILSGL